MCAFVSCSQAGNYPLLTGRAWSYLEQWIGPIFTLPNLQPRASRGGGRESEHTDSLATLSTGDVCLFSLSSTAKALSQVPSIQAELGTIAPGNTAINAWKGTLTLADNWLRATVKHHIKGHKE